jgi:hypothetical protein
VDRNVLLGMVKAMTSNPVSQYVLPGLTSSLVGEGRGHVRLLSSERASREWVTPHSHRFDFVCLVLAGEVENILFVPSGFADRFAKGTVRPVDGGLGKYEVVREEGSCGYEEHSTTYKAGETYAMKASQIHSIRFSRGAEVLFFEGPDVSDVSVFLEPFSNGKTIRTFETAPWMFERGSTEALSTKGTP